MDRWGFELSWVWNGLFFQYPHHKGTFGSIAHANRNRGSDEPIVLTAFLAFDHGITFGVGFLMDDNRL